MTDEYLIIGQIVSPKGIKGEVKVYPLSDFPERFLELETVYLDLPNGLKETAVKKASWQGNMVVMSFEGYDDRNGVEKLRQVYLKVATEQAVELPEGHYYLKDIVGLSVYTEEGEFWGKIKDVLQLYANDVYVLDKGGKEVLIPAIREIVKEIDIENDRMVIFPMEGLC